MDLTRAARNDTKPFHPLASLGHAKMLAMLARLGPESQEQRTGACRLMQRLQSNGQEHPGKGPVVGFVSVFMEMQSQTKMMRWKSLPRMFHE
jgi:hypothetical protein